MHEQHRTLILPLSGLLALGGCVTVDPSLDYERTSEHISRVTGQEEVYQPGDDEIIAGRVDELLADGITVGEAVQVCLLNNLVLQAAFMDIGMARADVVQSGMLANPSLGIALRLPAGGGLANLEAGLAQNIADLWQIPFRRRAAEHSLDRVILKTARQAADLAADAKVAYYDAVGAGQLYEITRQNIDLAQQLLDMALARQEAIRTTGGCGRSPQPGATPWDHEKCRRTRPPRSPSRGSTGTARCGTSHRTRMRVLS